MKRAAEKLNSRRGASILLALVFVLACVMVGVSVLSAAASNAGRTRSNHEEQQLYLSLSSALQLVAGDLSNTTYTPKVLDNCDKTEETYQAGTDENGDPIMKTITIYTHTFKPAEGGGSMDGSLLKDLFSKKLDAIFNTYMSKKDFSVYNSSSGDVRFIYIGDFTPAASEEQSFTLTVVPEDLPVETGEDTYHAAQAVTIDVTIDSSYLITLTAHLAGDDADSYAKNFRLSTSLTRSSASLPNITIPTTGSTTILSAHPAVEWEQSSIVSGYEAPSGGAAS